MLLREDQLPMYNVKIEYKKFVIQKRGNYFLCDIKDMYIFSLTRYCIFVAV